MVKCCIAVQVQSSVAASSCGVSMERNLFRYKDLIFICRVKIAEWFLLKCFVEFLSKFTSEDIFFL